MTQENIERLNKIKMDICYDWKQIKLQDIAWLIEQVALIYSNVQIKKHKEVHLNGDEA